MSVVARKGIRAQALFQVALPLVGLIALVGGLVYWRAKTALEHATSTNLQNLTSALRVLVETGYELTQRRVKTNVEYLGAVAGQVATVDAKLAVTLTVTDQLTSVRSEISLPALAVGGRPALGGDELLDEFSKQVGGAATIFQFFPGGMLRVATSVRKPNGERATLTYVPTSSPVYQALLSGKPYDGRAMVAGQWSVTSYRPVRDAAGNVVAALFCGLPQTSLDELRERVATFHVGERGFVQILDGDGKQIVHPDRALEGTVRKDRDALAMIAQREGRLRASGFVYQIAAVPAMSWIVVAAANEDDLDAPLALMRRWMAVVLLIGTVLAYLLATRFARKLAHTISKASDMMQDIASGEGDLTRRLESRGGDEVASMAGWFNQFVNKLQGTVREVASSAVSVSTSSSALSETAAAMDGAMARLRTRTGSIADGSANAARNLDSVSGATADFSASLTTAASAIEEMGATIRSISESCREEARITAAARVKVGETGEVVGNLHKAAREVGEVIEAIQEIASQTNLLALNAAIEAAGAGAAGKGFRIVADEVKLLSQQTAAATGQIQERVQRMVSEAARAARTVGDISEVIGRLDGLSNVIENMLKEQSLAVNEISCTVSGLDTSARHIAGNVAGSAAALDQVKTQTADVDREIAGTAEKQRALRVQIEHLASAAHDLKGVAGSFRT